MKKGQKLSVAKIVGSSDEKRWVQVHTFFPEEEEKKKKRGILLAVLTLIDLEAGEEGVEVVEVGREAMARLHEEYYGNLEGEAFEGLKRAVQRVKEEVKIEILAGAVLTLEEENVLYLVADGEGEVVVQRGEAMGEILKGRKEGIETASGYLEEGDIVVLGNGAFFKIVGGGILKGFLGGGRVEEIVDELAPMIHGRGEGIGAGALVCQLVKSEEKKTEEVKEKISEIKKEGFGAKFLRALLFWTQRLENFFEVLLSFFRKKDEIYIRGEKERKTKRVVMTVAVLMIGLLFISIFFGLKRRGVLEGQKSWGELKTQVEEKIGQAESLADLNPIRSRELLDEAKKGLSEWDSKATVGEKKEIGGLVGKIEEVLRGVNKKFEINSAPIFLDLNLIRKETLGEKMGFDKNQLIVLDKKSEVVLGVDIKNKQGKILGGRLGKVDFASVFLGKAFLVGERGIVWIDVSSGVASKAGETSEQVGKIVDFVAYAGNVYVLDGDNNQIWKFPGIEGGLGRAVEYLAKGGEFSSAVSMAIDGSIWVLTDEGKIYKFTQNRRDNFAVTGLDEDFGEPTALYTDEDCDRIYVLDKGKTRVVVIGKDGKYVGQYVWPGIAGVDDFVVSEKEGKILLLSESKIFEIQLK